jgi:hypothetical protein
MATAKKKKIKVEDLGHVAHSKAAQVVKTVKESRPLKIVFLGSGSGFLVLYFVTF